MGGCYRTVTTHISCPYLSICQKMLRDFVHYICLNLLCLITTSIPFIIVAQTAHHTPTIMSRHGPNVSIWVCQPTSICNFEYSPSPFSGPGSSVGTATELQAGRSGIESRWGRDFSTRSVGTATELQAGRSGIESRWGRDFPPVQTDPGAHPASCKMGT